MPSCFQLAFQHAKLGEHKHFVHSTLADHPSRGGTPVIGRVAFLHTLAPLLSCYSKGGPLAAAPPPQSVLERTLSGPAPDLLNQN